MAKDNIATSASKITGLKAKKVVSFPTAGNAMKTITGNTLRKNGIEVSDSKANIKLKARSI